MDIQTKLDEILEQNPDLQKYVSKLYYLPDDADIPSDVTHVLALASASSLERRLQIGAVVIGQYAVLLESLLALIATSPSGQ
jgi:hypothetical protein